MPTLGLIRCHLKWQGLDTPIAEHGTQYFDSHVQTYIGVPRNPGAFFVHVSTDGFIANGISAFVYIDGEYQCNRARHNIPCPGLGINSADVYIDLKLRQKEVTMSDGAHWAMPWKFSRVNAAPPNAPISEEIPWSGEHVGTIEVIILRLAPRTSSIPTGLMTLQARQNWQKQVGALQYKGPPRFGIDGTSQDSQDEDTAERPAKRPHLMCSDGASNELDGWKTSTEPMKENKSSNENSNGRGTAMQAKYPSQRKQVAASKNDGGRGSEGDEQNTGGHKRSTTSIRNQPENRAAKSEDGLYGDEKRGRQADPGKQQVGWFGSFGKWGWSNGDAKKGQDLADFAKISSSRKSTATGLRSQSRRPPSTVQKITINVGPGGSATVGAPGPRTPPLRVSKGTEPPTSPSGWGGKKSELGEGSPKMPGSWDDEENKDGNVNSQNEDSWGGGGQIDEFGNSNDDQGGPGCNDDYNRDADNENQDYPDINGGEDGSGNQNGDCWGNSNGNTGNDYQGRSSVSQNASNQKRKGSNASGDCNSWGKYGASNDNQDDWNHDDNQDDWNHDNNQASNVSGNDEWNNNNNQNAGNSWGKYGASNDNQDDSNYDNNQASNASGNDEWNNNDNQNVGNSRGSHANNDTDLHAAVSNQRSTDNKSNANAGSGSERKKDAKIQDNKNDALKNNSQSGNAQGWSNNSHVGDNGRQGGFGAASRTHQNQAQNWGDSTAAQPGQEGWANSGNAGYVALPVNQVPFLNNMPFNQQIATASPPLGAGYSATVPQRQSIPAIQARPGLFASTPGSAPLPYWGAFKRAQAKEGAFTRPIFDPRAGEQAIYSLPAEVIQRNQTTHQVQLALPNQFSKRPYTPKYLDTVDKPFAVFTFHYRDQAILSALMGAPIQEKPQEEAARLKTMSKDEILDIMLKERGTAAMQGQLQPVVPEPVTRVPPRYSMSGAQQAPQMTSAGGAAGPDMSDLVAKLTSIAASQNGDKGPGKVAGDENVEPVVVTPGHEGVQW